MKSQEIAMIMGRQNTEIGNGEEGCAWEFVTDSKEHLTSTENPAFP